MKKLLLSMLLCMMTLGAAAQSSLTGDVNGDGTVNITDVNVIISMILDGKGATPDADVNGDGTVNISDVNTIISIILEGSSHSGEEGDWVDLGLPSGTIWATRNVGASSPEDYGDYFAWGETVPKEVYNWDTYKWAAYDILGKLYLTKYNISDNKRKLDPSDDAACAHYPGGCMPTFEQFDELFSFWCTCKWTTRNGVNGYLFTGPNANTLFLPAAGYIKGSSLYETGSGGEYWTRGLGDLWTGTGLYLSYKYVNTCTCRERWHGLTVRAVRVSQD